MTAYAPQLWTFGWKTMPGALCSKSNSRKIVRFGERMAVIKSAEARQYTEIFIRLFKTPKAFELPVTLMAYVYYPDMRRDLDVALLQDCIQAAGIITNDRQIWRVEAERRIDKANPRTDFRLVQYVKPVLLDL